MEISPGGSWTREKQRVRRKLQECIAALKGSPYLPNQLDQVVRACLLPIFRYGAGMVDWTAAELAQITRMWANAHGNLHGNLLLAHRTPFTRWVLSGVEVASLMLECSGLKRCSDYGAHYDSMTTIFKSWLSGNGELA